MHFLLLMKLTSELALSEYPSLIDEITYQCIVGAIGDEQFKARSSNEFKTTRKRWIFTDLFIYDDEPTYVLQLKWIVTIIKDLMIQENLNMIYDLHVTREYHDLGDSSLNITFYTKK